MPQKLLETKTGQFKKVKALFSRTNREKYRQQIVEGPQAVRELLFHQPQLVKDVYVVAETLAYYPEIAARLEEIAAYVHILPPPLFAELSGDAQGILAVANFAPALDLRAQLAKAKLAVFALQASDPGNLGTIIRCADAFGADVMLVGKGSVDLTNPKVIRSTVGSLFHLPTLAGLSLTDVVSAARESGLQVLAADARGEVSLGSSGLDLSKPTLWVMGNEAHGFSAVDLELVDKVVAIPMPGRAESLNVAMAATICIFSSSQALYGS